MNEIFANEIINNWKYEGELSIYNYENERIGYYLEKLGGMGFSQ